MASAKTTASLLRRIDRYVVLPLMALLTAASLIPLIESNTWWIRYLDYPRLQFAAALSALLVIHLFLRGARGPGRWAIVGLAGVALASHAYRLYPYTPPVAEAALAVPTCPADSRISLLLANVKAANEQAQRLFRSIAATDPDLLLLMETDAWWDRRLDSLNARYPYRVQHIPERYRSYGMHLMSRYPLNDPEMRFRFNAFTPSVSTGVRLPGGAMVSFHGLHPRPPRYWSQSTVMRDAHLLAAAIEARGSDQPAILAGDFNAVPWESVTRRTMRIGRLLDPRIGRGLYPTYDAHSVLLSWPLDQVIYQNEFALLRFERLADFGSDHYPVFAELCHRPGIAERQAAPETQANDLAQARGAIEAAYRKDNSNHF